MDDHENARLTPRGREAMVRTVVEGGLTKSAARAFNTTPWSRSGGLAQGR